MSFDDVRWMFMDRIKQRIQSTDKTIDRLISNQILSNEDLLHLTNERAIKNTFAVLLEITRTASDLLSLRIQIDVFRENRKSKTMDGFMKECRDLIPPPPRTYTMTEKRNTADRTRKYRARLKLMEFTRQCRSSTRIR